MAAKGMPKTGGRKPGVTNKNSIKHDLHAQAAARGINVYELLLDFCGEGPPELRLNAIKELMKYLYPQKKAVEHSGQIESIEVVITDYTSKK